MLAWIRKTLDSLSGTGDTTCSIIALRDEAAIADPFQRATRKGARDWTMGKQTPDEYLAWFKRNKSGRSFDECCDLLKVHSFEARGDSGNHVVYKRGIHVVTVSRPHGRDKVVFLDQVKEVLRKIDAAKLDEEKEAPDVE